MLHKAPQEGPPIDDTRQRDPGYDLVRSFAILFTFLGHAIIFQTSLHWLDRSFATLSPGLTMSLLGFMSAILVSRDTRDHGTFLLRRFVRIYVPLIVCLGVALGIQAILGTADVTRSTILDFLGLTGFFGILSAPHTGSVGGGLWFVTAILAMYLLSPLLRRLFRHRLGLAHLVVVVALCIAANRIFYTDENWNVVIAFCVGTYLVVNNKLDGMLRRPLWLYGLASAVLIALCALATFRVIPYWSRLLLFPFYPLAFVPLFLAAGRRLPRWIARVVSLFAMISYEFYILQFYFINRSLTSLTGLSSPLVAMVALGFALTLVFAAVVYLVDSRLRRMIEGYLLRERPAVE